MRILHVLDTSLPLHSGYAFRTAEILRHQKKRGWETFQLTSIKQGSIEDKVEKFEDLTFYRTGKKRTTLERVPVANALEVIFSLEKRLNHIASQLRPDIIHAHSPVLNAIAAQRVGKRLGIPVVYEIRAFWEDAAVDQGTVGERSIRYKLTKLLETRAVRLADHTFTICKGLKSDLIGRGIDERKITVIPNAVDIEKFTPKHDKNLELATQWAIRDKIVLGFVGSFFRYEGLDLAINAMTKIAKVFPNAVLLLIGGGEQENTLRRLSAQLDDPARVIFTGRVNNSDISKYYSLIDIMLYPRRSNRLTELVTPLKPLESMAQGQIFIASDVGGHKELIDNRNTGILFKADDEDSLVKAVIDVVNDPALREQIARKARAHVELYRTWDISVGYYEQPYTSILNK